MGFPGPIRWRCVAGWRIGRPAREAAPSFPAGLLSPSLQSGSSEEYEVDFLVALFLALPAVVQPDSLRVEPAWGIAGHYGTWTVT